LTDGYIKHAAIKRTMGERIDHTTTNQKSVRMCVLRVNVVAPGETPPSNIRSIEKMMSHHKSTSK